MAMHLICQIFNLVLQPDEEDLDDLWGPEIPKAAPLSRNDDEDSKIKALVETPALDWQRSDSLFWFFL